MSLDAEALLRSQTELRGRIARTADNLKKLGTANITAAAHDSLCSTYWKHVSDHDYFKADYHGATENVYVSQRVVLTDWLDELRGTSVTRSDGIEATRATNKKLPSIQLPTFFGKYEEWPEFKDLFVSIVDRDDSLLPVEKLHYLESCLKGEAEQLLRNLPITGENYRRAWSMFSDHYANKRIMSCFAAFSALPKMKNDSVNDLRRVFHGMIQTIGALEGIGRPITNCSDMFVYFMGELLDPCTKREWEQSISNTTDPPAIDKLKIFLESRLHTLEALQPSRSEPTSPVKSRGNTSRAARAHLTQMSGKPKCAFCSKEHYILSCNDFLKKTPAQKKEFVRTTNLCYNCFGKHSLSACPSKRSCVTCQQRHHSSIHIVCATTEPAALVASTSLHGHAVALLATARVLVTDKYGTQHPVRILIDPGSEVSLVTESLAQRLRLPRSSASIAIYGVGGQSMTTTTKGQISLKLSSRINQSSVHVSALILPHISKTSEGRVNRDISSWKCLRELPLADPDFQERDPIEILLGVDVYAEILLSGVRKEGPRTLIAQETLFGWILSGTVNGKGSRHAASSHQCSFGEDLSAQVKLFWEHEEPPQPPLPLTEADQKCEEHFTLTHSRTTEGRYIVRLPVAPVLPSLADSRRAAVRTLLSMERRFATNVNQSGTFAPINAVTAPETVCYLPHHGVLKGNGDSSKLRVVFNGSSQLANGESLNANLLTGPNLLPALADVLTRWRLHRYVMVTDFEKMYRQILVHPDDRNLQRILWRANPNDARQEYCLNTVTYGLTCAPFPAIRTLQQLAMDKQLRFPLGAIALLRDVYVDDILTGADTIAEARSIQNQIIQLCMAGGFPLRKWVANCDDLMAVIPLEHRQHSGQHEWESELGLSTLGL